MRNATALENSAGEVRFGFQRLNLTNFAKGNLINPEYYLVVVCNNCTIPFNATPTVTPLGVLSL